MNNNKILIKTLTYTCKRKYYLQFLVISMFKQKEFT